MPKEDDFAVIDLPTVLNDSTLDVQINSVLHGVITKLVGGAVGGAATDATVGQPNGTSGWATHEMIP